MSILKTLYNKVHDSGTPRMLRYSVTLTMNQMLQAHGRVTVLQITVFHQTLSVSDCQIR